MINDGRRPSRSVRILCGAGAILLMVACSWSGLKYVVSSATGSRPEQMIADIIVPLAGNPDRAAYAHALLGEGIAPSVGSTLTDTECLRLRGMDLDSSCATGVRNTVDEAIVLRRLFKEAQVARAIVVTSPCHLARAAAVFSVIFAGTGIEVHFVATPAACVASQQITKEVRSYLPSLGAALVARVFPPAYEWSMRSFVGMSNSANSSF